MQPPQRQPQPAGPLRSARGPGLQEEVGFRGAAGRLGTRSEGKNGGQGPARPWCQAPAAERTQRGGRPRSPRRTDSVLCPQVGGGRGVKPEGVLPERPGRVSGTLGRRPSLCSLGWAPASGRRRARAAPRSAWSGLRGVRKAHVGRTGPRALRNLVCSRSLPLRPYSSHRGLAAFSSFSPEMVLRVMSPSSGQVAPRRFAAVPPGVEFF